MSTCCTDASKSDEGPACSWLVGLCIAMHVYFLLEAACTALHGIHTSKQPDPLSAGLQQ